MTNLVKTPRYKRRLLKVFLEFSTNVAQFQEDNPEEEVYCASLNISEVLRAGMGVIADWMGYVR